MPTVDPSDPALADTVDRLRGDLPGSALVGGAAVENLDLKTQLDDSTPLVMGVILVLGFLLLLVALQAPLIAMLGTLASLLSTAAAFGVARLIFQEGMGAGFFGFEPQGFLDAWAPVFFFAMIFAIAMDYTVFLLASAKEHYERSGDPHEAMVGALAHSGRVIFAAGAVMVAVFFTFALSGPAAAQGDGHHPRRRGAARRLPGTPGAAPGDPAAHRRLRLVEPLVAAPGRFPTSRSPTAERDHHVSSSDVPHLRQDHLGRLRTARRPGQGRCPGRAVVSGAPEGGAHRRRLALADPRALAPSRRAAGRPAPRRGGPAR